MPALAGRSTAPSDLRVRGRGHTCQDSASPCPCRRHAGPCHYSTWASDGEFWSCKKMLEIPGGTSSSGVLPHGRGCWKQWAGHGASSSDGLCERLCLWQRTVLHRDFCSKRPEHCDLDLFRSGADVTGNAVGERAFYFLPRECQMESCGQHFSQTHHVPNSDLANLQPLRVPGLLLPFPPASPCPAWRLQAIPSWWGCSSTPSPAFSWQERRSRELGPGLGLEPWAGSVKLWSSKLLQMAGVSTPGLWPRYHLPFLLRVGACKYKGPGQSACVRARVSTRVCVGGWGDWGGLRVSCQRYLF